MEIEHHDDANNLSMMAALSINVPCICQPLHRECDPSSCDKAPLLDEIIGELEGLSSRSSLVSSAETDLVSCTMSDLKRTALGGCVTCAIIYAGLKSPVSTSGSDPALPVLAEGWNNDWSDDELVVRVRTNLGSVRICLKGGGWWDMSDFTFYATPSTRKSLE